jgi:2-amino-4-hydroxy-6-hydroxymethyldihydropteridine diphosphokinase
VKTKAYVALGANLGARERNVLGAVRRLAVVDDVAVTRVSSLYESAAVGMGTAPPFVNAVVELVTLLSSRDLLERMQAIEAAMGRRSGHNQSREIDLDLIAFGSVVVDDAELVLPHPRYAGRAFVLVPLAEICPDFRDPRTNRGIRELLAGLADAADVRRVSGRGWVARA